MAGLIGAALAGGLAGAGLAAEKSFASRQEYLQKGDLLREQEEMQRETALTVEALRGTNQMATTTKLGEDAMARTGVEQIGATARNKDTIAGHVQTTQMHETAETGRAQERNTSEEKRTSETNKTHVATTNRMAAAHEYSARQHLAAAEIARGGVALVPDGQGRMMITDKVTGKSSGYLQTPDGKDFVGKKDLPESTLKLAQVYIGRAEAESKNAGLDPNAKGAADTAWKTAEAILTGRDPSGIGMAVPNSVNIQELLAKQKDPKALQSFDAKFGHGMAAQVIKQYGGTPTATGAAPAPAPGTAPAPNVAAPARPRNGPGSINGIISGTAGEGPIGENPSVPWAW